ncbi:MAG: carboxypeptidase regulatory-like domain-containing protein [Planctomycetaceae bacterium]|nr:carboxypeptidase regulatory-like domain-containing protein [Planctomycetaceae bacterium]
MLNKSRLTTSIVLATAALLLVPPPLLAADRPVATSAAKDISLTRDGQLQGRVLDSQGRPVEGASLRIRKGDQEQGQAITADQGEFRFAGMKSGLYVLEVAGQPHQLRLWSPQIAPPGAVNDLRLVAGDPTVRGQFGYLDPLNTSFLLLGVAGVTLSAISLNEINEVEKHVKALSP